MSNPITISLCGDLLISRRISPQIISSNPVTELLRSHECRFGNLETTIHRREGYPAAFPGGGYSMADPLCLYDLNDYGFNLLNTANNHSMDYSCNGLLATIKYLDEKGIAHAGTGANLHEACKPVYFECESGRVAMLGVTASYHDSYRAGQQNQEMMGRPGVAPLRHQTVYELDEKHFQQLEEIAELTGINAQKKQAIKEGYASNDQLLQFGNFYLKFKKGNSCKKTSTPSPQDTKRTTSYIKDAKAKSDIVIVSIHSHQFDGNDKCNAPEFLQRFAHECVDAGADIIVCHGPHLIRGVETYSGGIIFHGMGNFIFQHEYVESLPEEYYLKFGLTRQQATGSSELFDVRSQHGKKGLKTDPRAWKSVMASLSITDDLIQVTLYPVSISIKTGLPTLSHDRETIEEINTLSKAYGAHFDIISPENKGSLTIKRR